MIYVTNGYTTEEFDSLVQANIYIANQMDKPKLSYQLVYSHTENDIQVMIYQYSTLYLETFIVHTDLDLTNRRI